MNCHYDTDDVGKVFEWLKRRESDLHGLSSKSNRAILLCP